MKTKAIATIVITLFLVSIAGIASTASAKKPRASNDRKKTGENAEVRAELRVDPNGYAAAKGHHPGDLDDLQVALLSSGIKNWRVLKDSVQIDLIAGSHAVSLPVQQHRRIRDLNHDGIKEHLLEVDLAGGREEYRELTGFHPHTLRVRYISRVRFVPGRGARRSVNSSTVSASLFDAAVSTDAAGLSADLEQMASSSLLDAAMTTDDVSTFCYGNGTYPIEDSITCHFESSALALDIQGVVSQINVWIAPSGGNIPSDAQTVIEAYAGKGPPQRHLSFNYCTNCAPATGKPGAPGYASTAVSLDELDLLYIYVGQNGKADTFGAGSASLVSKKKLKDISVDNLMKPREVGIMVIAGSGGAGGGWNTKCSVLATYCYNGRDGYDGGQAPLSVDKDVSAAGGGGVVDKGEGEGGNLDGDGFGGYGGNAADHPLRAGGGGIGGYGGMDPYSDDYQSVFEGVSSIWIHGVGGWADPARGFATGGGGFGGGGGGGTPGRTRCGGGGGGSWSRQATMDPDAELVHGVNEDSDPTVLITFDVVYD